MARLLIAAAALALATPALAYNEPVPTASLKGVLQAAQFPALSGDCAVSAGTLAIACTKTGGALFGALATLTPGAGVAGALAQPLNGPGGLATWPIPGTGLAPGAAAANFGFTPLNPARNLSDLPDPAAGRSNLGVISFSVGQSRNSSVSTTNLRSGGGALTAGLYRLTFYLTVTGVSTGSVRATFGWADQAQARTSSSVPIDTSATNAFSDSIVVKSNGIADVTYATTLVGSATYSIDINVARLF